MNPHSVRDQLLYPHECFRALRHEQPVYNEQAKFWEVSTYEDVHLLVTDHELFSSDESKFTPASEAPALKSILNMDPPRHRQLRSLLSQAFTPRALAQLTPRITEITQELLDAVEKKGAMDIIDDLSYPLPIIVIAELLGVPIEDRPQFKHWSDEIVAGEYDELTGENRELVLERVRQRVRKTMDEINEYFRSIIAQRRQQLGEDIISALLAARVDGQELTEDELLGFCALLLIAGNITTTNLIGNALLCFDEHPEAMLQLQQRPQLLPSAIEEVLRYRSPVTILARFAASDFILKEQLIRRGQVVLGWSGSANHDPDHFAHPECFDITRSPNQHLSFGHGIHFCLGAPLARLEAKIALGMLLERFTRIRITHDRDLEPVNSTFIYGAKHVPITFSVR